jgi:hypothetical protein
VGDRTEPCGTPACIHLGFDISPSTETLNFRCKRKKVMSLNILVEKFNFDNLQSKPGCDVVLKASSISKNTAAVDILLLKFRVMWSAEIWDQKAHE